MTQQNDNLTTIIELAAQMGRHKTGVIRYVRDLERRLKQTLIVPGRKNGRFCLVVTKSDAKKILEHRKRDGFSDDGKAQLARKK